MYDSYTIVYNQAETHVALGWYSGVIQICRIDPETGRPAEVVHEFNKPAKDQYITFLQFIENDTKLLSLNEKGVISIWNCESGEREKKITYRKGMYKCSGSLSPDETTLFLYQRSSNKQFLAIDLTSEERFDGPGLEDDLICVKVFAKDSESAYYHALISDRETDTVTQHLFTVNIKEKTIEDRVFEGAPQSASFMTNGELFTVNIKAGIGVRLSYGDPFILKDGHIGIKVERFNLENNETDSFHTLVVSEEFSNNPSLLHKADRSDSNYIREMNFLLSYLKDAQITDDGSILWVTKRDGYITGYNLETTKKCTPLLKHGNLQSTGMEGSLNYAVARNDFNNYTLGVSPKGTYVAYCNPNEFFATKDIIDHEEYYLKLPAVTD